VSIIEQLEEGEITAEEAASLLEAMEEGKLAALAPSNPGLAPRKPGQSLRVSYGVVRVRVCDLASGAIKADLRLPLELVNTALDAGGRLSAHLDRVDGPALRELIARSVTDASIQTMETPDEQVEVSLE